MDSMKEMIEQRAYQLYLRRGKIPGFHEEDWAQAEKEIRSEIEARKKPPTAPVPAAATPVRQPSTPSFVRPAAPAQSPVSAKPAEDARIKPKEGAPEKPAVKPPKKKR